jgi:hypothetical protein
MVSVAVKIFTPFNSFYCYYYYYRNFFVEYLGLKL